MNAIQKMNKLSAILLILLSISWTTHNYETSTIDETTGTEENKPRNMIMVNDVPYNLEIELVTSENNKHDLVISIELNSGAHFNPSHATLDSKGKFYMNLGNYKNLNFESNIMESPQSVQELYPSTFVDESVNWDYENKVYKQSLSLLSKNDFEVIGMLRFAVASRSSLEEIPFILSYKDGILKITSSMC